MERLNFAIVIDAPKEKVWNTMLDDETYRLWTAAFMPGSHYIGEWSQGSRILFLGPGDSGEMLGMVSRIKVNRPYEYVSIEHIGMVQGGKEDTSSEEVKSWAGALENYIFKDLGGKTEVLVEMDTNEEYREMFQNTWPKALARLKELAEH
jgi:uncharacterized protein YndB with AHSA1/START domain